MHTNALLLLHIMSRFLSSFSCCCCWRWRSSVIVSSFLFCLLYPPSSFSILLNLKNQLYDFRFGFGKKIHMTFSMAMHLHSRNILERFQFGADINCKLHNTYTHSLASIYLLNVHILFSSIPCYRNSLPIYV